MTHQNPARVAFMAAGLLLALTGCIGGERLQGPTITVQNAGGVPIVVQSERKRWTVPAGETRFVTTLEMGAISYGATIAVLDAASCRSLGSLALTFEEVLDPLIVVPPDGEPTARVMSVEDRQAVDGEAALSPGSCLGPADGWSLHVVNEAKAPYRLAMTAPDTGGVAEPGRALFDVPANGSGTITWNSTAEPTAAGTIDLLGPTGCEVLDRVEHPAWGTFVLHIDAAGSLTIEPGPLPSAGIPLPGSWAANDGSDC